MVFHYPRLQATSGATEKSEGLAGVQAGSLERMRLAGSFRALPVKDANDGRNGGLFPELSAGSNAGDLGAAREAERVTRWPPR